jgi:uncharacterized membrane protein
MTDSIPTLLAGASTHERAEQIVEGLRGAGIHEILILVHPQDGKRHRPLKGVQDIEKTHRMTRVAKDATKGAVAGGLVGAAGIAVPFFGPALLAVAPLTAAAGALVGAAIGAVSNDRTAYGLDEMGFPDEVLPVLNGRLNRGEYLIFVRTKDGRKLEKAADALREMNCEVLPL